MTNFENANKKFIVDFVQRFERQNFQLKFVAKMNFDEQSIFDDKIVNIVSFATRIAQFKLKNVKNVVFNNNDAHF